MSVLSHPLFPLFLSLRPPSLFFSLFPYFFFLLKNRGCGIAGRVLVPGLLRMELAAGGGCRCADDARWMGLRADARMRMKRLVAIPLLFSPYAREHRRRRCLVVPQSLVGSEPGPRGREDHNVRHTAAAKPESARTSRVRPWLARNPCAKTKKRKLWVAIQPHSRGFFVDAR